MGQAERHGGGGGGTERTDKAQEDELTRLRGSGHGGGRADSTLLPRWQERLLTRRPTAVEAAEIRKCFSRR